MESGEWLATLFEENRSYLQSVAYRMLGSLSEADDAVQETWLRLNRSDAEGIENLRGWLTTVVARVCLDVLRSRKSRREQSLENEPPASTSSHNPTPDPEQEVILADSVGLALLVVLDKLTPAERLTFVLHDLFAVPFDQIASLLGRSTTATRQLASRARRRVQGVTSVADADLAGQKKTVDSFLAALRAGDLEGLLALLDPDFVIQADAASLPPGATQEARSARAWAQQAIAYSRGARFARPALVDGFVGVVVAPHGRLFRALTFVFKEGRISRIDVIGDRTRLQEMDFALLN